MKDKQSSKTSEKNKGSSKQSDPKDEKIVNQQEQQHAVNAQQELHEQDRPSGDYVSEREMSRQSQDKADTNQRPSDKTDNLSKKQNISGTNAENAEEDFQQ